MAGDAQSLREQLYGVVNHYAELADMARKGEVNPIGQIGQIIRRRSPYLLIVVRNLLPGLKNETLTYHEFIYSVIREAQQFPDQKTLSDSLAEIESIEENDRALIYAVKWMEDKGNRRPPVQELKSIRQTLFNLNRKYKERYAPDAPQSAILIPWSAIIEPDDAEEVVFRRVTDLVRRAIVEMHHILLEKRPKRKLFSFGKDETLELQADIFRLARFLFRCGFPIDRIASGFYGDALTEFLNEKVMDLLIETGDRVMSLRGVSTHLAMLCLADFGSIFELPGDYRPLGDAKELKRHIKFLKSRKRRGIPLLKKLGDLQKIYDAAGGHGRLTGTFMAYRYSSAFGDYHGIHRKQDARGPKVLELYQDLVDPEGMEKRTEEDLKESGRFFSTKTQDEMSDLVRLILESLNNPEKVRGEKVKVLGDISSGAMGKVSVGIFESKIVALKTVKAEVPGGVVDPVDLLKYEAAMHSRAQPEHADQHESIVEFYGLINQDNVDVLINGYYPNDNLTHLVETNWTKKYKPPFRTKSAITLGTMEVIANQLLDCLRHFRTNGIVHRDMKTDNILYMVDSEEKVNRIKVIDFGVGLAVGQGVTPDLFKGKVVGTFSYMAPEQARGRASYDSDLYSVGAIFTVLLTGKLPVVFTKTRTRHELAEQIFRIETEPRPLLVDLNPWLRNHPALERWAATVQKMLDRDPITRPSLSDVQREFDALYGELGEEKESISIFYDVG
ncbi:serine/threonine protein kinase [Thermodesulfobacteriota bacterium]